ncbi:hypothetical protein Tco_1517267 [Tanacetum coccineum]
MTLTMENNVPPPFTSFEETGFPSELLKERVTQTLVMRLRQHEETVAREGTGIARMRQRDMIQEGQVRRIRHEEEIDVLEYQVLTREIEPTLKALEEITQENVFCLGGNRDHSYVLYDRVMNPLAAQQEQKPRKDRGTRRDRHSTSSSAFDQPSSSYLTMMMMMMEMAKEPRVQALLPPFVMSIR